MTTKTKVKKCLHGNTTFIHVNYSNSELCEWTLRCEDCKKVLGFRTNTIKHTSSPVIL